MSTVFDAYAAFSDETTYGTGVAVTKAYEFTQESVSGVYERIESAALRSGTNVLRADRFVPNPKGASGGLTTEVLNQGLTFWLKYMLGTVTKTGAAAPFTQTATVGPLKGKSFTAQFNRVDNTGADNIFTYEGGKVASWELSNDVDGLLMLALDMDFAKETVGAGAGVYAKATPTFPTSGVLLSYVGGTVTIGGTAFDARKVGVKVDNGLKVDRYGIRTGGTVKAEPTEDKARKIELSLDSDFASTAQIQRVASATAAGALATFSAKWQTPDGVHSVQLDIPALRFDTAPVNVGGEGALTQAITGAGLTPAAGGSPITLTVITPDAA